MYQEHQAKKVAKELNIKSEDSVIFLVFYFSSVFTKAKLFNKDQNSSNKNIKQFNS